MTTLYILLFILVVAVGIASLIAGKLNTKGKGSKTSDETIYYQAKDRFFTKSEYIFYELLEKANNDKYHIFSKVRLEDIVEVLPTLDWKMKNNKRKSIRSRHIDFVLIDKQTGKAVKAIELDGNSHNGDKQKYSDNKKDVICKQAGIELVRVIVGEDFNIKINTIFDTIK